MFFSAHIPHFTLCLEGSGKIGNASLLMHRLYDYWYHKGYWGAVSASGVDFLNAFAVFVIVFVFTMRFQWSVALHCNSDSECASHPLLSGLAFPHLFARTFLGYLVGFVLLMAAAGSAAYEGVTLAANVFTYHEVEVLVRDADLDPGFLTPWHRWQYNRHRRAAREEGHEIVGATQGRRQALTLMSWGDFLHHMCAYLSREKKLKRCDGGIYFDSLRAMQTLMQKDNFLIALHDSGMMEKGPLRYLSPETLSFLVESALDPFGVLYVRDEGLWRVQERTTRYAVVNLVLYPFVAAFAVLKLLVKNAGQFKSNYRDFSQREWNSLARWRFRLYNEAPFLHACRLAHGRDTVATMTERLSVSNNLRHLARRLSSACVLVTMVLTFLNPTLFTSGRIMGLSLVWWLSLSLLLFSMFGTPDPREREYVYTTDLEKLVGQLHYCDAEWTESGDAFYNHMTSTFFKPRFVLSLDSLARALAAPFVLLYTMRDGSAAALLDFLHSRSVVVDGVGSVPADAVFEWESVDDGTTEDDAATAAGLYEKGEGASSSLLRCPTTGNGADRGGATSSWTSAREGARREKMERSIASFCAVYQQWMEERLETAQSDRDARNQPLYDFVQELNDRVRAQEQAMLFQSQLQQPNGSAPVASLFQSMNQSWVPPSRVARGGRTGTELGTPATVEDLSLQLCHSQNTDPRFSTAHEREQLFVSQVYFAHAQPASSAAPGRAGRPGAAYGTAPAKGSGAGRGEYAEV